MNEFLNVLIKRIVYTQLVNYKLFNNPLKFLEGDKLPLGSMGQEIFINPAKGRKFNVNDFAGLLAKYESDVKIQYTHLNSDIQYPVTITRAKLKDAFASWSDLEGFVNGITQSLYNGAYIDRYNFFKGLVAQAYNSNTAKVEVVDALTDKEKAEAFLTKAREVFLNMQEPNADYNAWRQVGGYGKDVLTWTEAEDIVFLIRNDIGAYLDVNILSKAFNIDKAVLLGKVKYVKDFTERDKEGNVVVDGSNIIGMIADKSWFRIKNQETTMDEFYNANNRTWNVYLNDVNMFQYSLFCQALIFATESPNVPITAMEFNDGATASVKAGSSKVLRVSTTPASATGEITFTSSDTNETYVKITKLNDREVKVEGVSETSNAVTITATSGNVNAEISVSVEA